MFIQHFQIYCFPPFFLFLQKVIEANIYTLDFLKTNLPYINSISILSSPSTSSPSRIIKTFPTRQIYSNNKATIARLTSENNSLQQKIQQLEQEMEQLKSNSKQ